jgi:ubiquinone/menaquinone biosynthesis C-methylase UbiE
VPPQGSDPSQEANWSVRSHARLPRSTQFHRGTSIKAGCPPGSVVLDSFMGSGTTAVVAVKQRKHFVGIEINPNYIAIAKEKLRPLLWQRLLDLA